MNHPPLDAVAYSESCKGTAATTPVQKNIWDNSADDRAVTQRARKRHAVYKRLVAVMVTTLACSEDQIHDHTRIYDALCDDSLDVVELVMALEEEFEVEIPDEAVVRIRTVDDAVNALLRA